MRGLPEVTAERVLLVGLGDDPNKVSEKLCVLPCKLLRVASNASAPLKDASPLPAVEGRNTAWAVRQIVLVFNEVVFRTDAHKE